MFFRTRYAHCKPSQVLSLFWSCFQYQAWRVHRDICKLIAWLVLYCFMQLCSAFFMYLTGKFYTIIGFYASIPSPQVLPPFWSCFQYQCLRVCTAQGSLYIDCMANFVLVYGIKFSLCLHLRLTSKFYLLSSLITRLHYGLHHGSSDRNSEHRPLYEYMLVSVWERVVQS